MKKLKLIISIIVSIVVLLPLFVSCNKDDTTKYLEFSLDFLNEYKEQSKTYSKNYYDITIEGTKTPYYGDVEIIVKHNDVEEILYSSKDNNYYVNTEDIHYKTTTDEYTFFIKLYDTFSFNQLENSDYGITTNSIKGIYKNKAFDVLTKKGSLEKSELMQCQNQGLDFSYVEDIDYGYVKMHFVSSNEQEVDLSSIRLQYKNKKPTEFGYSQKYKRTINPGDSYQFKIDDYNYNALAKLYYNHALNLTITNSKNENISSVGIDDFYFFLEDEAYILEFKNNTNQILETEISCINQCIEYDEYKFVNIDKYGIYNASEKTRVCSITEDKIEVIELYHETLDSGTLLFASTSNEIKKEDHIFQVKINGITYNPGDTMNIHIGDKIENVDILVVYDNGTVVPVDAKFNYFIGDDAYTDTCKIITETDEKFVFFFLDSSSVDVTLYSAPILYVNID